MTPRINEAPTPLELRGWRRVAIEGLAGAIEVAPHGLVPAYPRWTVRDLAVHVVRIYGNATVALQSGELERPHPQLAIGRDDEAPALANAVRQALREAETALERCQHDAVWTPVGARSSRFWERRLLREGLLHRWDAEQAVGFPRAPEPRQALELIDEFLDTDIARAFADPQQARSGVVGIQSRQRRWTVDLTRRHVATGTADKTVAAMVSGEPAAVWLWLMRRGGLPGPISIEDPDGSAAAFVDLIDQFNRPRQ